MSHVFPPFEPEKDAATFIVHCAAFQVLIIVDANIRFGQARELVTRGNRIAANEKRLTLTTIEIGRIDGAFRCHRWARHDRTGQGDKAGKTMGIFCQRTSHLWRFRRMGLF